jgi:hypothetical protein
MRWGRGEGSRIDRRPRLGWVRVAVDEAFNGILSSLNECLRAGVRRRKDLFLPEKEGDKPTNTIA